MSILSNYSDEVESDTDEANNIAENITALAVLREHFSKEFDRIDDLLEKLVNRLEELGYEPPNE